MSILINYSIPLSDHLSRKQVSYYGYAASRQIYGPVYLLDQAKHKNKLILNAYIELDIKLLSEAKYYLHLLEHTYFVRTGKPYTGGIDTSAKYFFLSIDSFVVVWGSVFGLWSLTVLWDLYARYTGSTDWETYAIMGLLVALCLSLSAYFLILTLNYWPHTKDRVLAFDPEARTLTVQTDNDEYVIGEGDIECVDVFSNENHRNLQEYYLFKLRDGRELIITKKTKGAAAIFDFFQDIPMQRHKQWLSLIDRETIRNA